MLCRPDKLTLFPATYDDVKASCTCPDPENPCKHIAAVYYLLAERFGANPFLIWNAGPELADLRISPLAGEAPEALVRRLGPAPIAAGGLDLADALADMYAQLAATAERRALAE